jgi:geranylgeranyl reductase family protein
VTAPAEVLVAGGGPAGSATAALLARRGHRVLLVDRAVFPRAKPCGDYLNPGCDAVLERLGMSGAVAEAAERVRGMRLVTADGTAVPMPFPRRTGWALARRRLDQALLAQAVRAGAEVRDGCRITALEPAGRAVRVAIEHGGHIEHRTARLVIGADGLRSTVARAAGLGVPVRYGRFTVGAYLAGLGGAAGGDAASGWGEMHLRPDGYCGVAHLADGVANVTLAVARETVRVWRADLEAGYRTWLRGCPGLRDRLARAERVSPLVAVGPLGFYRRRPGRGRVLLVGDAAAHVDPMTGQGVYLALRGAELCAAAAAAALERDGVSALGGYARARTREFAPVFAGARLVQALAARPAVMRRAAAGMARHPELARRLIGTIGNTAGLGSVLHPAVLPRLLGWA